MPTMKKPAADKGKGMYNAMKRPEATALPVDREKKAKHGEEEPEESEAESQVQPPSLTEEALHNHQRFLKEMSKFKDMSQDGFERLLKSSQHQPGNTCGKPLRHPGKRLVLRRNTKMLAQGLEPSGKRRLC